MTNGDMLFIEVFFLIFSLAFIDIKLISIINNIFKVFVMVNSKIEEEGEREGKRKEGRKENRKQRLRKEIN